jgi:predicted Holliday junction resolvase-like endonuclease
MWITIIIVLILVCGYLFYQTQKLGKELSDAKDSLARTKSLKKSSEVRLGFISEKLAPFLNDFDLDPSGLQFLGNPVDFVHFGNEKITIVEVKSGNSRLSAKQKKIKKMVEEKKIDWYLYRIK